MPESTQIKVTAERESAVQLILTIIIIDKCIKIGDSVLLANIQEVLLSKDQIPFRRAPIFGASEFHVEFIKLPKLLRLIHEQWQAQIAEFQHLVDIPRVRLRMIKMSY